MTIRWPSTFPSPLSGTWSESDGEELIEFRPDRGYPKVRAPAHPEWQVISVTLQPCTAAMRRAIDGWRRDNGKAAPFVMDDPIAGTATFRIRSMTWRHVAVDIWQASVEMERVP